MTQTTVDADWSRIGVALVHPVNPSIIIKTNSWIDRELANFGYWQYRYTQRRTADRLASVRRVLEVRSSSIDIDHRISRHSKMQRHQREREIITNVARVIGASFVAVVAVLMQLSINFNSKMGWYHDRRRNRSLVSMVQEIVFDYKLRSVIWTQLHLRTIFEVGWLRASITIKKLFTNNIV